MKKWLTSLFTLLVTLALLIGCANDSTPPKTEESDGTEENTSEIEEEVVVITISKDEESEKLAEKELEINENDLLMDVMKESFDIEEEGGFIFSIEGIVAKEEEKKSWMYFVNGEMAMVGADEYKLTPGDHVVFDLQAWE